MRNFLYRLFFTRDDDLDLLQVIFLAAIVFFYVAFSLEAAGIWTPSDTGWRIMERVFYLLAILGVPMWAVNPIIDFVTRRRKADESGEPGD